MYNQVVRPEYVDLLGFRDSFQILHQCDMRKQGLFLQ